MIRKILYSILGAGMGIIVGVLIFGALLNIDNNFIGISATLLSGIAFAFFGYRLSIWLNNEKNALRIQDQVKESLVDKSKSDYFIAGTLAFWQFAFQIMLLGISLFLKFNFIAVFLGTLVVDIFSSWIGVYFISRENYLKQSNSIIKISGQLIVQLIVVFMFIASVVNMSIFDKLIGIIFNIVVLVGSAYYFLKKSIDNTKEKQVMI